MADNDVFDRFRLDGKVAIVTGVGPGIGQYVAQAYAAAGAKVAVCARTTSQVEAVCAAIAADGGDAFGMTVDLAHSDQLQQFVAETQQAFGTVHILFNNAASFAGIDFEGIVRDPFSLTDADWQAHFDVNLMAPYRLSKAVVPGMKAAGYGSIINVTAVAGYRPKADIAQMAYGSTKAALTMMTRYIAKECGPEVRANMICPGSVHATGEMRDFWRSSLPLVPLGRIGRAEEVVGAALLLASPASSYTTGTTIFVDGGRASGTA